MFPSIWIWAGKKCHAFKMAKRPNLASGFWSPGFQTLKVGLVCVWIQNFWDSGHSLYSSLILFKLFISIGHPITVSLCGSLLNFFGSMLKIECWHVEGWQFCAGLLGQVANTAGQRTMAWTTSVASSGAAWVSWKKINLVFNYILLHQGLFDDFGGSLRFFWDIFLAS